MSSASCGSPTTSTSRRIERRVVRPDGRLERLRIALRGGGAIDPRRRRHVGRRHGIGAPKQSPTPVAPVALVGHHDHRAVVEQGPRDDVAVRRRRRLMDRRRRSLAAVRRDRRSRSRPASRRWRSRGGEERVGLGRAHALHVGAGQRLARVLDALVLLGQIGHDDGAGRGGRDDRQHQDRRHRHRDREPAAPAPAGQGGRRRVAGARASSAASRLERSRVVVVVHHGHLRSSAASDVRRSTCTTPRPPGSMQRPARPIANPTAPGLYDRREGGLMAISERAGRPADPSILVDVDRLIAAYYEAPDPSDPAQRVAFGTSGPSRVVAQRRVQRGAHRGHDRGDLPLPASQGTDGPLFIGKDTARAVRAGLRDGAAGPRRARRRRPGRRRRRLHADPGHLARDPRPQPRPARPPGRRHRRHAVAQPARGRRLQVQPAQRRPGRHRRHRLDPGRGEPAPRGGPRGRPAGAARGRARGRHAATTTSSAYVDDLGRGHRHGRHPRLRPAPRRRPARWRERRLLAAHRRALRPRPDRHEHDGRPAVRVHDLRLGRPDPDGPVVAVRDGPPGRAARPVRRRLRQRHRRRPARHRHARRRPDEPEPLPVGVGRAPVRWRARLGRGRRRRQDPGLVAR